MSQTLLRIALVAIALLCFGNVHAQDTQADRVAAVDRYFKIVPFDQMIQEMSAEMANGLPAEQRPDFIKFMTTEVRFDVVLSAAKVSLAKHLTTDEINALAAFMETPLGKSSMGKMKYYMADLMPVIQSEVKRAIDARTAPQKAG